MLWYKYILLLLLVLLVPKLVSAQLVINEVYPAPKDSEYEWVELYNPTNDTLSTDQFILKDLTGKAMTFNDSSVPALSYGLATSSALLNNKDETLFLTKKNGELIQTLSYSIQFDSEKSYSTCSNSAFIWQVTAPTKLVANACPTPTPLASPTTVATPTMQVVPTGVIAATSYDGIYINEVMAAPEANTKEWLELYNSNDTEVTLTNWYIDSYQFTITIPAHGYATIEMSSSLFNNSGDSIKLYDSEKNSKDSYEYSETQKNITWGRLAVDSDSFCLQQPSKTAPNAPCISPTSTQPAAKATAKTTQKASGSTAATTKSSAAKNKSAAHQYEGIIDQNIPAEAPTNEKEYRISGYKNEAQPALVLVRTYGFYLSTGLSLLAFGMIAYKMKRYLYEKDSLMALAMVTAICINGYYLHTLLSTQRIGIY